MIFCPAVGEVCKALVLSSEEFEEKYGQQKPDPSDDNILFYCMAGIRSRYAMNAAHTLGYEKLVLYHLYTCIHGPFYI